MSPAIISRKKGGRPKVLVIASGGGHWVQILRLRPAFSDCRVTYASVRSTYAQDVPGEDYVAIEDATRWDRVRLLKMFLQVFWLVMRLRPEVIISTGAAPGYVAIRLGKMLGARTVWLDSIANVEALSLSGKKIGPHVDLWLTQWPHLAGEHGPHCKGAIL